MRDNLSLTESIALLPEAERRKIILGLQPNEAEALLWDWKAWARPKQLPPPEDWFIWYIEAGRGFGKNRTGAEWIRACMESGDYSYGGIVGPTIDQTRNRMIDDPESGLLAVCPPWNRPTYNANIHKIIWPDGAVVEVFSAEKPDRLRGANLEIGWADEIGTWKDSEPLNMFLLCIRKGPSPRVCITGTPKPVPHVRALAKHPACVRVKGSTYENRANLAPQFFAQIVSQYEGTRLGRQEIYGEVLEAVEGALWSPAMIERNRMTAAPPLERIVVGVDPEAGAGATGIVTAGIAKVGDEQHGFILSDATLHASPDAWARAAIAEYSKHRADRIVYEKNQGGEMVEHTLRTVDKNVPLKDVWASKGKQARAEPVAALYEQGRIHHVGFFGDLESELCSWVPGQGMPSPHRFDALVWAVTELMLEGEPAPMLLGDQDELGQRSPFQVSEDTVIDPMKGWKK